MTSAGDGAPLPDAGEAPVAEARRGGALAVALAALGGLALVGGTTADWIRLEQVREVGGVRLGGSTGVAGTEVAGPLVGLGIAAIALALGLLVARGRLRRAVAVLLAAAGLVSAVVVAAGLSEAAGRPGSVAAGPGVAALGAAAVLLAAAVALRRPAARATLPPRYDLDLQEEAGASEWDRASVEPDTP